MQKGEGIWKYIPRDKTIIVKGNMPLMKKTYLSRIDDLGKVVVFYDEEGNDLSKGEPYLKNLMEFLLDCKNISFPEQGRVYGSINVKPIQRDEIQKPLDVEGPHQIFKVFSKKGTLGIAGINEVLLYLTPGGVIEKFSAEVSWGMFKGRIDGESKD